MWRKACVVGGLAMIAFLAMAVPSRAAVFHPTTATLANGLQIIIVPNHLSPAVHQMVWYKVGSADEVAGKTGLAHYLEHLMFRGSKAMPSGGYSSTVASWGGKDNAFTSYDYTAYFITAASDRLAAMMALEAERMQNLSIQQALADPELQVVLNERQERTDNNPEGRFGEKLRSTLLPDHPYGRPVIGWKKDIEGLTAQDATDFYLRHYAPNNAVVVITGDVTPQDVLAKAAAIYGAVPRRDVPVRQPVPEAPLPREDHFIMTDHRIEQPQMLWQVAVTLSGRHQREQSAALEVLAEILDGQAGVLYRQLVTQQAVATNVEVAYDTDARGITMFSIGVTPRPDVNPQRLQAALSATLQDALRNGVTKGEVDDARRRLIRAAAFARDSLMMPAYVFGMALTTGHAVEDVEAWPNRIAAVSPDSVRAALRTIVTERHAVTAFLYPEPEVTAHDPHGGEQDAVPMTTPDVKEIR